MKILFLHGYGTKVKSQVTILHSPNDDVVPLEDSKVLLHNSGLGEDHLVIVGDNYNMVDEAALKALAEAVEARAQS